MNKEPYKLTEDGTVVCCGWCFPGRSILEKHPELAGKDISHGICPAHKADFLKELDALSHLSRSVGK